MTLVVHELKANSGAGALNQKLTVAAHPLVQEVYYARPHILKYGSPAGSLYMELCADSAGSVGAVLATSDTVAISSISTSAHFHGYVRFTLNVELAASTPYWLGLRQTGYTFDEAAYIGWCNDYDLGKYGLDYTAVPTTRPLDVEVYTRRVPRKGRY